MLRSASNRTFAALGLAASVWQRPSQSCSLAELFQTQTTTGACNSHSVSPSPVSCTPRQTSNTVSKQPSSTRMDFQRSSFSDARLLFFQLLGPSSVQPEVSRSLNEDDLLVSSASLNLLARKAFPCNTNCTSQFLTRRSATACHSRAEVQHKLCMAVR